MPEPKKSNSLPQRAFELKIKISGDTWEHVINELAHLSIHIPEHGPGCDSVSGSPTSGHTVICEQNPEMTNERYFQAIATWKQEQRR